jgi:hypothetical protein
MTDTGGAPGESGGPSTSSGAAGEDGNVPTELGGASGQSVGGAGGQAPREPSCGTTVGVGGDFPHVHPLTISWTDVLAGKKRRYDLPGDHGHDVIFDEQDFARIAAGEAVEKLCSVSAPGPHTHTVQVVCVDSP